MLLLGHPVGHSLSPAMQAAAFTACGVDARYLAVDVTPAELAGAVRELRQPDVVGANVTVPHKVAVMPLMDELSADARRVGAVNTVMRRGSRLVGDNTDSQGFLLALGELGLEPRGLRCVVLGAGGAARAVAAALLAAGAEVALHNRSRSRAEQLAAELAPLGHVALPAATELGAVVRAAELLVQASAAGMEGVAGGALPLPEGLLPRAGAVMDLVYRPLETPLLARARAAGLATQSGLPMLLHQGALAFERWFRRPAPIEDMRRAALAALG